MSGLLLLTLIVSAVLVVQTKYRSRILFSEQQRLALQRDEIDVEWGRLQLELATWGTHGRVSRIAEKELGMHIPVATEIRVLRY